MKLLLFVFSIILKIKGTSLLPTIETIPPTPNNTLATGYSGLIVRAQFKRKGVATSYKWRFSKDEICQIADQFFVFGAGCVSRSSSNCTITCHKSNGVITSKLTYLQPVTTNLNPSVRKKFADGYIVIELPSKTVQDCPQTLPNNVTVQFNSAGYNDAGTFTCSNNGRLFYSNGSQPTSNRTTCLYTAEWSGQDNVTCWTAPNVTMNATNGIFTVVKGNDLTVACKYNDVMPTGTNTSFYFNGNKTEQQERSFTRLSLQRKDNNKPIFCQAVTPYTEIYHESGRSPNYTINVQYAPFRDNPTSCKWNLNQAGLCNVIFMSNPPAKFLALIKNDSEVSVEEQSRNFMNDGNSQTFQFRTEHVNESDNGTYILHLRSSVSSHNHTIQFDINVTTMSQTVPSGTPDNNTSNTLVIVLAAAGAALAGIIITVVLICCKRRKASGKMKGNVETPNVVYSHVVQKDKKEQASAVEPAYGVVNKKKKKNDSAQKEEKINPLYVSSEQPDKVEPAYGVVKKNKKKKDSAQKEEKVNPLYVSSDQPDTIEPAYGVVKKAKKKKDSSQKQGEVNPLSVSSDQPDKVEPAHGVVKKNMKKKGTSDKEERTNPLYVSSDPPTGVEPAYGVVTKKRKKKGNKPNQTSAGPSTSTDYVEEAYAEVKRKTKGPRAGANKEVNEEAAYAEVNKPRKKKKPPPQPSRNGGGEQNGIREIALHGTSYQVEQTGPSFPEL